MPLGTSASLDGHALVWSMWVVDHDPTPMAVNVTASVTDPNEVSHTWTGPWPVSDAAPKTTIRVDVRLQ